MKKFYQISLLSCISLILAACAGSGNNARGSARCNTSQGYYCVQSGDTLYRISQRFNTSVSELKALNQLRGDTIHVGQSLRINRKASANKNAVANNSNAQLQWPLKGSILQNYSNTNRGIDIEAPAGSTVVAAGDGQVIHAGDGVRGYGNLILIRHSNTLLTAYANNDRLLVSEKARVKAGQPIATVGHTGRSDGQTALHFEVRVNGKAVNPNAYLPKR
ncbi:murein hydrolase activator EnvC family protein [Neisseriaceae bacterium B1]